MGSLSNCRQRILKPHTQLAPDLMLLRQSTNLPAIEVRDALKGRGSSDKLLPIECSPRVILHRNYRLQWRQKAESLMKTVHDDAIFDNVKAVRVVAIDDPETLEISGEIKRKRKPGT